MKYALAYDIGTTGVKTCLFEIGSNIRLIAGESEGYPLYVLPDGGAEQDPDEWWSAMCNTTKAVLKATGIDPKQIDGISFCSQAQGLVLVDKEGKPVRRAMSYMDQRARKELKRRRQHLQADSVADHHRRGVVLREGPDLEIQLGQKQRTRRVQKGL